MTHLTRYTLFSLVIHLFVLAAFVRDPPPVRQPAVVGWVVDLTTDPGREGSNEGPESHPSRPVQTEGAAADEPQQQYASLEASRPADAPIPPPAPALPAREAGTPVTAGDPPHVDSAAFMNAFQSSMNVQALLMQMRRYFRQAGGSVKGMIDGALPAADRIALEGEQGVVVIAYGDGAIIDSLSVTADNELFRSFLMERVLWNLAPSPRGCSLPFKRVIYSITLAGSSVKVVVSPG